MTTTTTFEATRSNAKLNTAIINFGGSLDAQWDTLASLTNEAIRYYWNKSYQSAHLISIYNILQHPDANKRMAKAFLAYVKTACPVILAQTENCGKSNKKQFKAMNADHAATNEAIMAVTTGLELKAMLGEAKKAKKSTIATRLASLTKAMKSDDFDLNQMLNTSQVLADMLNEYEACMQAYNEQLGGLDYDANDAVEAA